MADTGEAVHREVAATWSADGLLALSDSERQGLRDFWEVYDSHHADIVRDANLEDGLPGDRAGVAPRLQAAAAARRRAFVDGDWQPFMKLLGEMGAYYGRVEASFLEWYKRVTAFRAAIQPYVEREYAGSVERCRAAVNAMHRYLDFTVAVMAEGYLETMRAAIDRSEQVVARQQDAIRELSTPVLEVQERLLIVPLIGQMDSRRAQQLTAQLLRAIRDHRAKAVVIDITGVASVDTGVANHLIQTTDAARLLGATVFLTGVSQQVGEAIVALGIDVSRLHASGDLRSGIENARSLIGSDGQLDDSR